MIELIPKTNQSKNYWVIIFYLSLFLAAILLVAFFVMQSSLKASLAKLDSLQNQLGNLKTPAKVSLEKEVLDSQKKINDFSLIATNHLANSNIFGLIQQICHPKVWFSSFSFDSKDNQVSLSGTTDSFESLAQQIMIMRTKSFVKDLELQSMATGSKKEIVFSLIFLTNPQIFK